MNAEQAKSRIVEIFPLINQAGKAEIISCLNVIMAFIMDEKNPAVAGNDRLEISMRSPLSIESGIGILSRASNLE